jgi:hypothetical protein
MKQLFRNKFLEISLVKGFIIGVGVSDSNSYLILFFGPLTFDFTIPKKEIKSPYEIEL